MSEIAILFSNSDISSLEKSHSEHRGGRGSDLIEIKGSVLPQGPGVCGRAHLRSASGSLEGDFAAWAT